MVSREAAKECSPRRKPWVSERILTSPEGAKETPAMVKLNMPERCPLYYITDRTAFAADEPTRRRRLLEKITEAARAGVDYIQLREKDLTTRELESLARDAVQAVHEVRTRTTALLINSRTDIALAVGAEGVHLRSDDVSPRNVRDIWKKCGAGAPARENKPPNPVIGVSCHELEDLSKAKADGATFAVFAPIFEKKDVPNMQPAGLAKLRQAAKAGIPVLALGGVTVENAHFCLKAGAAGIAAIRLFQENDIAKIVKQLRPLPQ
jgi:thiamine-phosphate pyrophosphorylase